MGSQCMRIILSAEK